MILVADSGSTKTDWRICLPDGSFEQFESIGLNPNFSGSEDFSRALHETFSTVLKLAITKIWFYGAGCGSEKNQQWVKEQLEQFFAPAHAEVAGDMLGAARALCGTSPGMAAILGTGMNTCVYDGKNIIHNHFSVGYVLGDEGSGAYLGKRLLSDWLKGKLPLDVKTNFEKRFPLTPAEAIENIYRKPLPNRFLAQFSKFIYQNLKQEYCINLVVSGFQSFFREQIKTYPNFQQYQLHLTGSVAFYFSNLLQRVATEEGVNIGKIVEKPIAALALYHMENTTEINP